MEKRLGGPLSLYGIELTESLVLRSLSLAPDHKLRRIDLAEAVGLSASGVTRVLNPMEKIGLVEKDHFERDARVRLVALTDAGKSVLEEVRVGFDQAAESVLAPIVQLELSKWLIREVGEDEADRVIAYTQMCTIVPLDTTIALLAADLHREYKLAIADAIVYATARHHAADLLTCDAHFKGLPGVLLLSKPI